MKKVGRIIGDALIFTGFVAIILVTCFMAVSWVSFGYVKTVPPEEIRLFVVILGVAFFGGLGSHLVSEGEDW
jgi:hypothetical protein